MTHRKPKIKIGKTCESCGFLWAEHMGNQETCRQLMVALKENIVMENKMYELAMALAAYWSTNPGEEKVEYRRVDKPAKRRKIEDFDDLMKRRKKNYDALIAKRRKAKSK